MLLCSPPLTGCLVTDQIEFEVEKNIPPVILDKPGTDFPIGGVFWIDLDSEQTMWSFDVVVRDENTQDDLRARVRVRTQNDQTPQFKPDKVVPITGTVNRDFTVELGLGDLKEGECHQVDLAVSGSFFDRTEPFFFKEADPADDVGLATWLVWEGPGEEAATDEEKAAIVTTCETSEAFLQREAEVAP